MKKLLVSAAVVALLASCGEDVKPPVMFRAKCLESGTVTYAKFPDVLIGMYQEGDTVWVNMRSHFIDDRDTTAQKCVLTSK
jgi:hypothetical protein